MTDKERLEEIKKLRETILEENDFRTRCVLAYVFVNLGYMDWLIEQAERVQELEETNKKNYWIASDFKFKNLVLEQQNKRYREALEEILAESYEEAGLHPDTNMQLETFIAKTARKALEESEAVFL